MLAELNAFEAERIGEVWKEVHARRLADGYAPNGKPRFGYAWDPAAKLHVVDDETGPVLTEAYTRYVAGESVYSLIRWLNASGVRTTAGAAWSDQALRRVMDAGFAAGFIAWHGQLHEGRHERLINRDLWQAYLDARHRRRSTPSRTQRSQYVLSGIVRCGRCQGSMVANTFANSARAPAFRCRNAKEFGPERCAGGYVAMHVVETEVRAWLSDLATDVESAAESAAEAMARRVDARGEVARLRRRLVDIGAARTRLTSRLAEGLVSDVDYIAAIGALAHESDELTARVEEHGRELRDEVRVDAPAAAEQLLADWTTTLVDTRREVLRQLIDYVEVTTGPRTGGDSAAVVMVHAASRLRYQ